jgi:hypothetical protein
MSLTLPDLTLTLIHMQVNTRLDARKVKLRLQVVASQPLVSLIQIFSALTRPVAYLELRGHHGCVIKLRICRPIRFWMRSCITEDTVKHRSPSQKSLLSTYFCFISHVRAAVNHLFAICEANYRSRKRMGTQLLAIDQIVHFRF